MPDTMPHGKRSDDDLMDDMPGRIPPPAADSGAGQSVADSFEEDTRTQLNLLRERTFNPELKELVDRVRDNEPSAGLSDSLPEDVDGLSEDELRLQLYRLFYRARMLHDNREMNISFNPFEIASARHGGSFEESLTGYITERMSGMNLPHFAIMSYNIMEKGYIPSFHNLERFRAENLVIGLRDRLFRDILESGEGVILDADDLGQDPFLEKIFVIREGDDPRSLYFLMISRLVADVARELQGAGSEAVSPFLPSDILMVELPLQTSPYNLGAIFGNLRKKLALPFYLISGSHSLVFTSESYEDIDYSYHVLDYLFAIFMMNHDSIGISIKSKANEASSRTFLMKYIISQLGYKLHADSVLVHIIKGQIIILTKDLYMDVIKSLILEYNKLFSGQFDVVEFRPSEFRDSLDIIQKIVLVNK